MAFDHADETPEQAARKRIIADLYAVAENGTEALLKAWKEMPEKARAVVGTEFKHIKAHAAKVAS